MSKLICRLIGHAAADCTVTCFIDGNGNRTWNCPRCQDRVAKAQRAQGLLVYEIYNGEIIPRGYGIAWVRWNVDCAVCMPIPLNIICGAVRSAWWWMKAPRFAIQNARDEYRQGIDQGIKLAERDKP